MAKSSALVAAIAVVGSLGACNAVLGITQAEVDSAFIPGGSGNTGGGGGSGSASGGGGSGGSDNPFSCENYCRIMDESCTSFDTEYNEVGLPGVCLTMCAKYDKGTPGDTKGNTLGCRLHWAEKAAANPADNCPKAGPLATDCTDKCDAFCILADALCSKIGEFPYNDFGECVDACKTFTYLTRDSGEKNGDIAFYNGDTLNCRLYHLENAYDPNDKDAAVNHCGHTAVDSNSCN